MSWDEGEEDDLEPTVACSNCRQQIYEDAVQCPYCGHYQTDEDLVASGRPRWVVITALVLLAWMAYGVLRVLF